MAEEIKWLEISIETTPDELDNLTTQLTDNGVTGLVIEDEQDFLAFLAEQQQYWDYVDDMLLAKMKNACRVKFYISDNADGAAQLARWLRGIDLPYTSFPLNENDWAHSWQKYYKPLVVGQLLYIIPEWERDTPVPVGRVPLYLNPGLTFGTGSHASTQLCLAALERYVAPGCHVLDLGCGSGILSIAAINLGSADALAVDIDPKAADVAYENAGLNAIGKDRYAVRTGNILEDPSLFQQLTQQRYELVLANIVADVIIPLSSEIPRLLSPKGIFLCSGIIDTRANEVAAALERNHFMILDRMDQNGWVAFAARHIS